MMFHDADAADKKRDGSDSDHDGVEHLFGALLLGEQFGGNDDAVIVGAVMRGIQHSMNHLRGLGEIALVAHGQIDAVDLIPDIAVTVFEAEHGRLERNIDVVVDIA